MAESPELSGSLWKTAAMRFAENLIGAKIPTMAGVKCRLRRWLNEGEVIAPRDGESINLVRQGCDTSCGQAVLHLLPIQFVHLLLLDMAEALFW